MKDSIPIKEFIKTLTPITDFSKLQKGDKIFNRCSLSVDYVDTFDHIKRSGNGKDTIFYKKLQR